MSNNVVYANFGIEREWEKTRTRTTEGLLEAGLVFGDDEDLMRAKADCLYQVLRQMVNEVPSVRVTTKIPEDLSPAQQAVVLTAIQEAALRGIEVTLTHAVSTLMASAYDLCTSRLAKS